MSLVSNGSLKENGTQYIGSEDRLGLRPNSLSSCRARSIASGIFRNSSHTAGAPDDSAPLALSNSPLHVTDRSPRIFRVLSAFICPALGMPTMAPYCCWTEGSDAVASMRPYSSGGPWYLSRSGRMVEALTVAVGNLSGAPART